MDILFLKVGFLLLKIFLMKNNQLFILYSFKNFISKKKFFFIPESDKKGKFILGENPNLLKEYNINQSLKIKLSKEEKSWKFNLDNIIIENISINGTNKDIIFINDNNSDVHFNHIILIFLLLYHLLIF